MHDRYESSRYCVKRDMCVSLCVRLWKGESGCRHLRLLPHLSQTEATLTGRSRVSFSFLTHIRHVQDIRHSQVSIPSF